jgi:hypothetical protein
MLLDRRGLNVPHATASTSTNTHVRKFHHPRTAVCQSLHNAQTRSLLILLLYKHTKQYIAFLKFYHQYHQYIAFLDFQIFWQHRNNRTSVERCFAHITFHHSICWGKCVCNTPQAPHVLLLACPLSCSCSCLSKSARISLKPARTPANVPPTRLNQEVHKL